MALNNDVFVCWLFALPVVAAYIQHIERNRQSDIASTSEGNSFVLEISLSTEL